MVLQFSLASFRSDAAVKEWKTLDVNMGKISKKRWPRKKQNKKENMEQELKFYVSISLISQRKEQYFVFHPHQGSAHFLSESLIWKVAERKVG